MLQWMGIELSDKDTLFQLLFEGDDGPLQFSNYRK